VELTHVDAAGAARMVDVSDKPATARTAVASGVLRTTPEVVDLLRRDGLPKGDALATARIAGIMGAKRTPELVPLCHPIALSGVALDLELDGAQVRIRATVRTTDRTGVEMEALTAVAVAGLALHDMVKAVDPAAVLDGVRVERKEGGKTGTWTRAPGAEGAAAPPEAADPAAAPVGAERPGGRAADPDAPRPGATRGTARVVTASNRAAAGVYADRSGPVVVSWLRQRGFTCPDAAVVPDGEPVGAALRAAVADGVDVVITTGGTGISPTDATPEVTRAVLDHELPGLADAIRAAGAPAVPTAVLSRGLSGVAGRTLVVNLPGSTGGVRDGLGVLDGVLHHAVDQLRGEDHRGGPGGDPGSGGHPAGDPVSPGARSED
jgi:cyclic pyranopterin phosphate synthase